MNNLQLNLNNYKNKERTSKVIIIIITALMILIPLLLTKAIDKQLDNQEIMLCQSALKSRNQEYLNKCDCYYKTNNIKCLYKGKK